MDIEHSRVDCHAHYWPSEMVAALDAGRSWHGWTVEHTPGGAEVLACPAGQAPFLGAALREPFADRAERRRAEEGIDMEALMVPAFLWNYHLDGAAAAAYCRDVNDELADLQRSFPDRLVGLAVLPLQDPLRAAKEIERCVKDRGLRAFALGTHMEGRNLDDPDVVPTLDAIFEADATLMMHPNWFDRIGHARMPRYYFSNSFGVPLEVGLAVMSIAYSGVLDRHPAARVGITHGGGWLPYGIGRLLLRTGQGRDGGGYNQQPPDLYLRRFFYDILIHDELSLEFLVRRVGADRLLIGTDYPFGGDIPGGAVKWIEGMGFLTTREKEQILGGNAYRFLGLGRSA